MTCPARRARQRLTFGGNNRFPIWSSDGKRVAFQSDRDGDLAIFWQPADGTGTAERLTKPDQGDITCAGVVVSEGRQASCSASRRDPTCRCGRSRCRTGRRRRSARSTRRIPSALVFSPDGRWVAYASTERGSDDDLRPAIPSHGGQVSARRERGSDNPHMKWPGHQTERNCFTIRGPADSRPSASRRNRRLPSGILWRCRDRSNRAPNCARTLYDITPGGKFVGLIPAGQTESGTPTAPQIQVVLNWFEELKRLVPTK